MNDIIHTFIDQNPVCKTRRPFYSSGKIEEVSCEKCYEILIRQKFPVSMEDRLKVTEFALSENNTHLIGEYYKSNFLFDFSRDKIYICYAYVNETDYNLNVFCPHCKKIHRITTNNKPTTKGNIAFFDITKNFPPNKQDLNCLPQESKIYVKGFIHRNYKDPKLIK